MKAMKHTRLASAKMGDDTGFSRFVKVDTGGRAEGKRSSPYMPGFGHPAVVAGRSLFHRRGVKLPSELNALLVSGHSNVKIGNDVRVRRFRGYRIYTLSLEERATCPTSCHHWQNCYGNGMPYAKRVNHRGEGFLEMLADEVEHITRKHKQGALIRLHALGDFYNPEYVEFWSEMLTKHPKLALFGYTAWEPTSPIGQAVDRMIDMHPGRAMMRFSNGKLSTRSTVSIMHVEDCPPGAFVCPEQTGQFPACGKCGACWSTLKNVAFLAH